MNQPTFDEYKQQKKMESAKRIMNFGLNLFWIINGALTAVYGFIVIFMAFDFTALPYWGQFLVFLLGIVSALVCVSLTDGARFLWAEGRSALNTSGNQQIIAGIMEVSSFLMSVGASVVAMRVVFSLLGVSGVTAIERSHFTMITIFSIALVAHLLAGFLYNNLSPESKLLRTTASSQAALMDTMTTSIEKAYDGVQKKLPGMIGQYEQEIVEKRTRQQLRHALSSMGHGEIDELPDHVSRPEEETRPTPYIKVEVPTPKQIDTPRQEIKNNSSAVYVNGNGGNAEGK